MTPTKVYIADLEVIKISEVFQRAMDSFSNFLSVETTKKDEITIYTSEKTKIIAACYSFEK
jgi:hypothetical protein